MNYKIKYFFGFLALALLSCRGTKSLLNKKDFKLIKTEVNKNRKEILIYKNLDGKLVIQEAFVLGGKYKVYSVKAYSKKIQMYMEFLALLEGEDVYINHFSYDNRIIDSVEYLRFNNMIANLKSTLFFSDSIQNKFISGLQSHSIRRIRYK